MFKALFKKTTVEINKKDVIKKIIDEWFLFGFENKTEEEIKNDIIWRLESEIENRIKDQVLSAMTLDCERIVSGIAKELLDNYDFKTPVQSAMHDHIKSYLSMNRGDGPHMYIR